MEIDEEIIKIIIKILYFIGVYFTLYWLSVLILEDDEEEIKEKRRKNWPAVTIILPMYNEEKYVEWTLDSVFNLDYPKNKLKVIAVNDGSTDNTLKILKKLKRKYDFMIINKKNGGKHTALNKGLEKTDTPFFACLDSDCYVEKDALKNLVNDFTNRKIAAVMPIMKVNKPSNLIQRVQWIEYMINIFLKYLIGKLDCIHVTPGPFTIYRTNIVKKLGGFRRGHLTEDLEMAMRLQKYHYKIKQSLNAVVYTASPKTIKAFVSQRTRWYQGTLLNMRDYKEIHFNRKYEEFGLFYIPLVTVTGFLLITGIIVTFYLFLKNIYHTIKRWYLTNFDFLTYLQNLNFNIQLIDLDWQVIFTSLFLFILLLFVIYLAFTGSRERIAILKKIEYFLTLLYYFTFYNFLLGYVWFKVLYRIFFKKSNKWEKVN